MAQQAKRYAQTRATALLQCLLCGVSFGGCNAVLGLEDPTDLHADGSVMANNRSDSGLGLGDRGQPAPWLDGSAALPTQLSSDGAAIELDGDRPRCETESTCDPYRDGAPREGGAQDDSTQGVGTLNQPCSPPGAYACAGRLQKGQLICAGVWVANGTCSGDMNCDSTPGPSLGSCQPVIPECAGKKPNDTVCIGEDIAACGPDLVTTVSVQSCTGATPVCRDATCVACTPNSVPTHCSGATPQFCNANGTWEDRADGSCSGNTPACLNGVCVTCAPNSTPTHCSGATPQFCNAKGVWEDQSAAACTGSRPVCIDGACVACAPNPAPTSCDGDIPQFCNASGTWEHRAAGGCSGIAPVCRDGGCIACTANSTPTHCAGSTPQFCATDGAWQDRAAGPCSGSTPACFDGSCVVCTPNPTPTRCSGATPQFCNAKGAWQNQAAGACAGATPTCFNGACVACTPNSTPTSCTGSTPQFCNATGAWQNQAAGACTGSSPACLNGTCVACTPNSTPTRCSGTTPQFCSSSGAWQNQAAGACAGATPVCLNGACVACTPNPTPTSCTGSTPQFCNATGAWQNQATGACSGSTPACLNGTCVACAPNSTPTRCSGTTPQYCDTSGAWRDRPEGPCITNGSTPICESGTCRAPHAVGIKTGAAHSCVRTEDGKVKCWGYNDYGQLGIGSTYTRGDTSSEMGPNLPSVELGTGRTAAAIALGSSFTCALLDDRKVKCWGYNNSGQLGLGTDVSARGDNSNEMGDSLPAVDLGTSRTATAIAAGESHTCARLDNGQIKCWGNNSDGQLGLGHTSSRGYQSRDMGDNLPVVDLGTNRTAAAITAGQAHTCARLDNGQIKCWGNNDCGQLGLGDRSTRGERTNDMGDNLGVVNLGQGRTATAISAGASHTCALLDNGQVKCWGCNSYGQLGLGDTTHRGDSSYDMGDDLPAVNLGAGHSVTAISAGDSHTCALLDNGQIKCWGYNSYGQLGIGATNTRGTYSGDMGDNLPTVNLGTGRTASALSAGTSHTCVVLDNGQVKCWGYNSYGQLGLGDTTNRGDSSYDMGDNLPAVVLW